VASAGDERAGGRYHPVHGILELDEDPMRGPARGEQPLYWVGSAKRDLLAFPEAVKDVLALL